MHLVIFDVLRDLWRRSPPQEQLKDDCPETVDIAQL